MAQKFDKRVLVVEDDDFIAVLIHDTLTVYGYDVIVAVNAEDGIARARDCRPDIILMDIQLPRISGLDATRILKHDVALQDIPVIAVTAHAMAGDREKMLEGGCQAYLSKPFKISSLLSVIETTLNQASAADRTLYGSSLTAP